MSVESVLKQIESETAIDKMTSSEALSFQTELSDELNIRIDALKSDVDNNKIFSDDEEE